MSWAIVYIVTAIVTYAFLMWEIVIGLKKPLPWAEDPSVLIPIIGLAILLAVAWPVTFILLIIAKSKQLLGIER